MLNKIKFSFKVADKQVGLFTPNHTLFKCKIKIDGLQYTFNYQCNTSVSEPNLHDCLECLIEETVQAVNEGSRLSIETDEALKEVVVRAQKVMDAVTRISQATDAQSRDVQQVSTGIDQISSVVQTNSATAEESAAASEELSGQASVLKELVGQFTLRQGVHR